MDAASQPGLPKRPSGDRWMPGLPLATLAVVAAGLLIARTPGDVGFTLVFLGLFAVPVVLIAYAGVAIWFALRRRFRRAASVIASVAAPFLLWGAIGWVVDVAHLGIALVWQRPHIDMSARKPGPVFVDDWSVGFAGGSATFLVYDKNGSVARPLAKGTHQADNDAMSGCADAEGLVDHFYVCTVD